MNILSIAGAAVVAAAAALVLRRQSPQTALMISIAAGALILLSVVKELVLTADEAQRLLASAGIRADDIMILLKCLGICLLTEFSCDTVTEAGMLSLSSNLALAGKALVLAQALPMIRELIDAVTPLVNVS